MAATKLSTRSVLAIATAANRRKRGPISFREGHEQALFATRMALDPRTRDLLWSATMTGVNLGIKAAALRKKQGVRRGVPDFILYEPAAAFDFTDKRFVGLALEFKSPDGSGRLSLEQAEWHRGLKANGWQVGVVLTAAEAWRLVADHLGFAP